MAQQRQLAAILFTDIVGYTALMQENEQKAVALIKHYNSSLNQLVLLHGGKVLNYYGDGSLCTFSSATEALNCAMELQRELKTDPSVPLRIGLHIGEIFFEDYKALGDGVNIASRIQSLGHANTILFSKEVYDKIRNQPEFKAVSLGTFNFKNIDEPLEVFALANDGLVVPRKEQMSGKLKEELKKEQNKGRKNITLIGVTLAVLVMCFFLYSNFYPSQSGAVDKSIAVLPFANVSDDPKQDYFSQGMMDEILNNLFKISDLNVISRSSSMAYKGTKKNTREVANELGANNLLEGSVQKDGNRIRIIIQLINAKTDKTLWSETYDREMKDIFAIQSDIANQVANALKIKLSNAVKIRMEYVPTENTEAYNQYLKGKAEFDIGRSENGYKFFSQAINLDSNFADPYAWLGLVWLNRGGYDGAIGREEAVRNAEPLIQKALKLDPDLAAGHIAMVFLELWFYWNFSAVEMEYQKILQLNPSNTEYIVNCSDYLNAIGKHKEALKNTFDAFQKDKNYADNWNILASTYYFNGQNEKASEIIKTAASLFPPELVQYQYLRLNTFMEKYKDVILFCEKIDTAVESSFYPMKLEYLGIAYFRIGNKNKSERATEILKSKSELSSVGSPSYALAAIYAVMGKNDEAINWLQKSFRNHEVELFWLNVDPLFLQLHNNPKFKEVLHKIGFS